MSQQPNLAADGFVQVATRLWRAMEFGRPKLSPEGQAILQEPVGEGTAQWPLAMVLAGWRLCGDPTSCPADMATLLEELGIGPLVTQISRLQKFLPDSFEKFAALAQTAETEPPLAGAGTFFASAVNDLGDMRRSALQSWLRGAQFQQAAQELLRHFPQPGGKPAVKLKAPTSVWLPAAGTRSRIDRFDRADFEVRRPVPRPTAPPPRPPVPVLDEEDIARAYLFSVGWAESDVDRLIKGPAGATKKPGV